MYGYINQVLASYFSSNVGDSEEDAIHALRKDVANSVDLNIGLQTELKHSFGDAAFSWKEVLAEHEVFFTESEDEARAYAKKILWVPIFKQLK